MLKSQTYNTPQHFESLFKILSSNRFLNKGDFVLFVVGDAERAQPGVPLIDIGVHVARKVATVDIGTAEGIADAFVAGEISLQKFGLLSGGQFGKGLGGGVGKGGADAQEGLKGLGGIGKDAGLVFKRLAEGRKGKGFRCAEAGRSIFGGRINHHGLSVTLYYR